MNAKMTVLLTSLCLLPTLASRPAAAQCGTTPYFTPAANTASLPSHRTFPTPSAIRPSDVDGDGDMDLLVAQDGQGRVDLIRNFGPRDMRVQRRNPALSYTNAGEQVYDLATGDLDNDGDEDLVLVDLDLRVFLNDGLGRYTEVATFDDAYNATTVRLADLDDDGFLDMVSDSGSSTNNLTVRWGAGGGSFPTSTQTEAGALSGESIGDVNGDGLLDLVTVPFVDQKIVDITVNVGNRDFLRLSRLTTTAIPVFADLSDLDDDGDLDILTTLASNGGAVAWLNDGFGLFLPGTTTGIGSAPLGTAVLDVDGDLDLDLAVIDFGTSSLRLAVNNGEGGLSSGGSTLVQKYVQHVDAADFDGDGLDDVVTSGYFPVVSLVAGVGFYYNNGCAVP